MRPRIGVTEMLDLDVDTFAQFVWLIIADMFAFPGMAVGTPQEQLIGWCDSMALGGSGRVQGTICPVISAASSSRWSAPRHHHSVKTGFKNMYSFHLSTLDRQSIIRA